MQAESALRAIPVCEFRCDVLTNPAEVKCVVLGLPSIIEEDKTELHNFFFFSLKERVGCKQAF